MYEAYPNLKDFVRKDLKNEGTPFLENLLGKMNEQIAKQGRVLVLTLTKRSSEEVTNFLVSKGYKAFYLHSEIDSLNRWEIIKKLKS